MLSIFKRLLLAIVLTFSLQAQEFDRWDFRSRLSRELSVRRPRMSGVDVTWLQERLYSLGYTEVGEIDGYYGPKTKAAVDAFCTRNGLPVSEALTADLWFRIFDVDALMHKRGRQELPVIVANHFFLCGGWSCREQRWIGPEELIQSKQPAVQSFTARGYRDGIVLGHFHTNINPMETESGYWMSPTITIPDTPRNQAPQWLFNGDHDPLLDKFREVSHGEFALERLVVSEWLSENKQINAAIEHMKVYEMDFDDDGRTDQLIESSNFNRISYDENETFEENYFCILLLIPAGGYPIEIASYVSEKMDETDEYTMFQTIASRILFSLDTVLDINGDRKLEFVIRWEAHEGSGSKIIPIEDGEALQSTPMVIGAGA